MCFDKQYDFEFKLYWDDNKSFFNYFRCGKRTGDYTSMHENPKSCCSKFNLMQVNFFAMFIHLFMFAFLLGWIFTENRFERQNLTMIIPIVAGKPDNISADNTSIDYSLRFPAILLSGIFAFLSFFAHFVRFAVEGYYKHWYWKYIISKRYNWIRWIEYTFSATIMLAILIVLAGVVDIWAVICACGCNVAVMLFGDASDRFRIQGDMPNAWKMFWYGSFVYIFPWVVLFSAFGVNLNKAKSEGLDIPPILYTIPITLFNLFSCFAINQFFLLRMSSWAQKSFEEKLKDTTLIETDLKLFKKEYDQRLREYFIRSEFIYDILSATAKVSLELQAFFALVN